MASRFERAHEDELQGTLTTVDRLIIHGHLRQLWYPNHMAYFLDRLGLHIVRDFGRFVKEASDRVKAHAEAVARKAKRPFLYQDRVVHGKDDIAREIAARDGIKEGLVCVLSTVELASCFSLAGGAIRPRLRKCLHLYFYVIDRELGLIHIRLQTWFPFQIQIYLNGREWLARQLERRGVGFERYQNTFLSIEDLPLAQKLCAGFTRRRWSRLFDAFARRINPWLPVIGKLGFGSYYWCIDACEVATDLMWRERRRLSTSSTTCSITPYVPSPPMTWFASWVRSTGRRPARSKPVTPDVLRGAASSTASVRTGSSCTTSGASCGSRP